MSERIVSGYCDPKFAAIEDEFSKAIQSGFDTGASVAIEYQGEMVVNLWGGYKDRQRTQPWLEDTIVNVFFDHQGDYRYLHFATYRAWEIGPERPCLGLLA